MADDTLSLKLLTLGDSGVGKSWLLLRWSDPKVKFSKGSAMPTIGIDFKQKIVDIEGKRVKVQIWDTAGQERFRTITTSYYRNTQGIVLVYDITSRSSFENLRAWMKQIKEQADPRVNKILVGNKCDLLDKRVISKSEGETLAQEFNMPFIETSALTGTSVDEAFLRIAADVKNRIETEPQSKGHAHVGGQSGAAYSSSSNSSSKSGSSGAVITTEDWTEKPRRRSWC